MCIFSLPSFANVFLFTRSFSSSSSVKWSIGGGTLTLHFSVSFTGLTFNDTHSVFSVTHKRKHLENKCQFDIIETRQPAIRANYKGKKLN